MKTLTQKDKTGKAKKSAIKRDIAEEKANKLKEELKNKIRKVDAIL